MKKSATVRALVAPLAFAALVLLALAAASLVDSARTGTSEGDAAPEQEAPIEVNDVMLPGAEDSFTPHGSEFGKNETVAVKTDLAGVIDSMSVTEWIKNPKGLDSIEDASDLQSIVADDGLAFERDGDSLKWSAGGSDVSYSGVLARELPFEVGYRYELNGKEVEPVELRNASGTLTVHIAYKNNAPATISTDWATYEVKDPFVMASVISFDPEHASDVTVDNGTVVDQQGMLVAVGVGMPGLAQTLGVADEVELPEDVTISAEVRGFDMPEITTVATDRLFGRVDAQYVEDARNRITEAIGQLDAIAEATNALAEGNGKIAEATGKISEGQAAMAENLPNATEGIEALVKVADSANEAITGAAKQQSALAQNTASSVEKLQQAAKSQGEALSSQAEAADHLAGISLDDAIAQQQTALEALQSVPRDALDDDAREALDSAIKCLQDSIQGTQDSTTDAQAALGGAQSSLEQAQKSLETSSTAMGDSMAALAANEEPAKAAAKGLGVAAAQTHGLSEGLGKASKGFAKVQEGTEQLSDALVQVSVGAKELSTASSKMSSEVEAALASIRDSINEKVDLVNAISDYVSSKPAFAGSAPGMPTSTLYVLHATSEITPLRSPIP